MFDGHLAFKMKIDVYILKQSNHPHPTLLPITGRLFELKLLSLGLDFLEKKNNNLLKFSIFFPFFHVSLLLFSTYLYRNMKLLTLQHKSARFAHGLLKD